MLMENENLKAEVRNSSKQGKKKFLATGSANTLMSLNTDSWNEYGFSAGFLPLFLWKPADKLFFESHFHVEGHAVEAGHSHGSVATTSLYSEANISLAYANLSWLISKYVILNAGYFPTPFGIYNERMHPEWINKLADSPLGSGHDRTVGPSKELGVQLRGSFKVQNSRLNYALYASNGPQLDYTSGNAGMLLFGSVLDNNFNKAIGGRVGFLPLNRSDFEVGVSVQVAKVGDKATLYEHLGARMYAVDMSFNLKAETVKGVFNFKSQLAYTSVDNANYTLYPDARIVAPAPIVLHNGTDTITYYYINTSHAGFAILSFRPSLSQKSFLSRLEIVGRFDEITLPKNAFWTLSDRRWTIALDYWLEPRSVLKFVYEIGQYKDFAMVQFVIGF